MKKLYITDLDGTFLSSDGKVSDESRKLINKAIDSGALFSVATARSILSAKPLLEGINFNVPIVVMSGVLIYDFQSQSTVRYHEVNINSFYSAIEVFQKYSKSPFAFLFNDSTEEYRIVFTDLKLQIHKDFYEERHKMLGKAIQKAEDYKVPSGFKPIFFSLCDEYEDLVKIKAELERIDGIGFSFYKDTYTPYWFLEVFNEKASKADGAEFVKNYVKADGISAFGDNLNDIPMFKAANERLAVKNAVEELKNISDEVILSNDECGVAKFILKDIKKSRQ